MLYFRSVRTQVFHDFSLCLHMRKCWQVLGRRRGGISPCRWRIPSIRVKYTACTAWLAIPYCCGPVLWFSSSCRKGQRLSLIRCTAPLVTRVVKGSWDFLAGKACLPWEGSSVTELKPLKSWRLSWIFNCFPAKDVTSIEHSAYRYAR